MKLLPIFLVFCWAAPKCRGPTKSLSIQSEPTDIYSSDSESLNTDNYSNKPNPTQVASGSYPQGSIQHIQVASGSYPQGSIQHIQGTSKLLTTVSTPENSNTSSTSQGTASQDTGNYGGTKAYCTYHSYDFSTPLTSVACSDGSNGLMTRWNYNNLTSLFPYVSAYSGSSWNSASCGDCMQLHSSATGKTIYVTVIDQCGYGPSGEDHFDLGPPAFTELFGQKGIQDGTGIVTYQKALSSLCHGNKG